MQSETLVRLDGAPGYVECVKAGDVTVMAGKVRTIVPSGDVEKRVILDKDRAGRLRDIDAELDALERQRQLLREEKRRVIYGL